MDAALARAVSQLRDTPDHQITVEIGGCMYKQSNMAGNLDVSEDAEMERRLASIKTALFLLASSLVLPMIYYLTR